jgi:hypothetical protein
LYDSKLSSEWNDTVCWLVDNYALTFLFIPTVCGQKYWFVMFRLCTNKNHSYKHNEQINSQNIDNSECFGVRFVKIYPHSTNTAIIFECICIFDKSITQWLISPLWEVPVALSHIFSFTVYDYIGIFFLHVAIFLGTYCIRYSWKMFNF